MNKNRRNRLGANTDGTSVPTRSIRDLEADWLNSKCGVALGAAREKVRVAHALETLPKISAAMARGEVSYSKARALTRVANEATEEYFLSTALHDTPHHVERLVQGFRRAKEAEEISREARQHVMKARLPADVGVLLVTALDAALEEFQRRTFPRERRR